VLPGTLAGVHTPAGEGKFFFTVMAALAELECDLIHRRTMAGLEAARRQGRMVADPPSWTRTSSSPPTPEEPAARALPRSTRLWGSPAPPSTAFT
jgi:DNA invertase Pin-like site-specific DNA recombinase